MKDEVKSIKIVPGIWYSGMGFNTYYVVKVSKAPTNSRKQVKTSEFFNQKLKYNKLDYEGTVNYKEECIKVCSQEWLNEHLPDGHKDKLINKNNENGEIKNNEVCRSNSNGSKPKGRGKVTISNRRQSVSTGSRPKGNKTIANYCKTRISSIEIKRATIFSGYN